jgi:hypothetical protein
MPKLSNQITETVESAEASSGFELIKPGKYAAKLSGVEARETNAGNPMWVAEFSDITAADGTTIPGRQWYNLNLPLDPNVVPANYPKTPEKYAQAQALSAGRLKAFFEAFGYTADSDTDEMIGETAVITVGVRVISSGTRQGEEANEVRKVETIDTWGGAPVQEKVDPTDF